MSLRTSRRYRRLRAEYRAESAQLQRPCWLCSQPIDYTVERRDPMTGEINEQAWTLDHLYPVSTHPHMVNDPGGFRDAHWRCNVARSNSAPSQAITKPSRRWLTP